ILTFDGKDVKHIHYLPRLVAAAPVGENAELTIWRDHAKKTVSVTIAKLAEDNVASNDNNSQQPAERSASPVDALGLNLATLTPDMRQQFGIDQSVKGVVV